MRQRDYFLYYLGLAVMIIAQVIQIKSGFVESRALHFGRSMLIVGMCIMVLGGIVYGIRKYRFKKRSKRDLSEEQQSMGEL